MADLTRSAKVSLVTHRLKVWPSGVSQSAAVLQSLLCFFCLFVIKLAVPPKTYGEIRMAFLIFFFLSRNQLIWASLLQGFLEISVVSETVLGLERWLSR